VTAGFSCYFGQSDVPKISLKFILNILYSSCVSGGVCETYETVEEGVPMATKTVYFKSAKVDLFNI